jgi:hypothetical protein
MRRWVKLVELIRASGRAPGGTSAIGTGHVVADAQGHLFEAYADGTRAPLHLVAMGRGGRLQAVAWAQPPDGRTVVGDAPATFRRLGRVITGRSGSLYEAGHGLPRLIEGTVLRGRDGQVWEVTGLVKDVALAGQGLPRIEPPARTRRGVAGRGAGAAGGRSGRVRGARIR